MNRFLAHCLAGSIASALTLMAAPLANARDYVNWSINMGVPAVSYPVYASPVYTPPPIIYQQTQSYYVEPAPVYYQPAPVYVRPAPIYGPVVYYESYPQPRYWGHGHHGHWRDGYGRQGRDVYYYPGR